VTHEGRYIPAIIDVIRRICAEKTWVLPAHDLDLANFEGRGITIDLFSSAVALELATVDHLLGDAGYESRSPPPSSQRRAACPPTQPAEKGGFCRRWAGRAGYSEGFSRRNLADAWFGELIYYLRSGGAPPQRIATRGEDDHALIHHSLPREHAHLPCRSRRNVSMTLRHLRNKFTVAG